MKQIRRKNQQNLKTAAAATATAATKEQQQSKHWQLLSTYLGNNALVTFPYGNPPPCSLTPTSLMPTQNPSRCPFKTLLPRPSQAESHLPDSFYLSGYLAQSEPSPSLALLLNHHIFLVIVLVTSLFINQCLSYCHACALPESQPPTVPGSKWPGWSNT